MSKDERAVVLDEIHELLRAKRLALMPPHHGLTSVFPAGSVAERFGMTVSIEDVSGQTCGYGLQPSCYPSTSRARRNRCVGPHLRA